MDSNLKSKERYLFVRNDISPKYFEKYFRANYIDVVCEDPKRQIRVFNYETKNETFEKSDMHKDNIHVMPFVWINNVFKLEDIVGKSVLPLDVVRIIDSFW
jgi:disulfide oxidoreductase YuzD